MLQNGIQLAALPSELTGVLTGALLIIVLSVDWLRTRTRRILVSSAESASLEETDSVKNSQVAVLCAAALIGAVIVAATNVWLVHSLRANLSGSGTAPVASGPAPPPNGHQITVAMMPKAKGDPYFVSCRSGAEEAAKELGINLIWDGPTSLDAARQNEVVEDWITQVSPFFTVVE